ncbi:MAG: hypothetical protein ACOX8I_06475 [Bacillota bacterium]
MSNHRIKMSIDGEEFETFDDTLPQNPEFKSRSHVKELATFVNQL